MDTFAEHGGKRCPETVSLWNLPFEKFTLTSWISRTLVTFWAWNIFVVNNKFGYLFSPMYSGSEYMGVFFELGTSKFVIVLLVSLFRSNQQRVGSSLKNTNTNVCLLLLNHTYLECSGNLRTYKLVIENL